MGMGIAFENGYSYGHGFLKPVTIYVPDFLVKGDQNIAKSKNKCYARNFNCILFIYMEIKFVFLQF